MAQSQTQLAVMALIQMMTPLWQMPLNLLSLLFMTFLHQLVTLVTLVVAMVTLVTLVNQKLALKMFWSMGVTRPCWPMT